MKFLIYVCMCMREREREKERERERERETDRQTDRDRETETERQRQRDRGRETETERQRQRDRDRETETDGDTWHGSERKKSSHVGIVCENKITKHMKFWCSMSIFCFREALAYLGLQLRATFQKEIDKQGQKLKKKRKKKRGEAQEAFVKCGSRHKKARSRKLFLNEGWAVRNFQN